LGIRTVAVFSEADRSSLHARFADEAICIGPSRASESYLNVPAVMSAAEIANVDAIHPGYGLLSENANFAEVCETCRVKFIGPSPEVIRLMGDKERARETANKVGLPIIPGSEETLGDEHQALRRAAEVGYPVMLKAAAGGGGRGMRLVRSDEELPGCFSAAQSEAASAFGNGDLYLEKYIEGARHIEFQVVADDFGNVIHLGERECSIQRRHQKLIEESPSLQVSADLRAEVGATLVAAMKAIGYTSLGTVEFLMDRHGRLYFIEMNTRIQVEHPVTEMVTGVDMVKTQILMAAGRRLTDILPGIDGDTLPMRGHAIECRINAENPVTFAPSAGLVHAFHPPGGIGIRVDTAAFSEGVIPPYYDSLIAKLIAYGIDRQEALARMQRALEMFVVEGIDTSIPLHQKILADPDFRAGRFDTQFMNRYQPAKPARPRPEPVKA
jgi:acetyl-CoA carboxylase biotin carboxylase subunit